MLILIKFDISHITKCYWLLLIILLYFFIQFNVSHLVKFCIFQLMASYSNSLFCLLTSLWYFDVLVYCCLIFIVVRQWNVFEYWCIWFFVGYKVYPCLSAFMNWFELQSPKCPIFLKFIVTDSMAIIVCRMALYI